MKKEEFKFIDLKYKPKKTDVICQYKITPAKGYTLDDTKKGSFVKKI